MKLINQYIQESILDDEDVVLNNTSNLAVDWVKQNVKGNYKITSLKSGLIKINGDLYINNFNGETIPPLLISKMKGNLNITSCPNLQSISNMFSEDATLDGNLNITSCPNLQSLNGLPCVVENDLSIVNNKKIKSLDGAPAHVFGIISIMKNGKKWKPEQISKVITGSVRIDCGAEEDSEMMLCEALNEPHLIKLASQLNKLGKNFNFKSIFEETGIRWDNITSGNTIEFKYIDDKARATIKKRLKEGCVVLVADVKNMEYKYIINTIKSSNRCYNLMDQTDWYFEPNSNNSQKYSYGGPRNRRMRYTKHVFEIFYNISSFDLWLGENSDMYKIILISPYISYDELDNWDMRNQRRLNKEGMIKPGDVKFNLSVAQKNIERYKKLIIINKTRRANNQQILIYNNMIQKITTQVYNSFQDVYNNPDKYMNTYQPSLYGDFDYNMRELNDKVSSLIKSFGLFQSAFLSVNNSDTDTAMYKVEMDKRNIEKCKQEMDDCIARIKLYYTELFKKQLQLS